jgi:6-phospho-beta-glucosidase
MKGLKVAVIGAGSTYTPELINGFIKRKGEMPVRKFCLMDIDREKLDIVGKLAIRMLNSNEMEAKTVMTEDLREALDGADYVVAQIRVGKLDARIKDEKIPLKYGLIGQETTGIGGFMKGLRTIPVIMNITEQMKKYCPQAWLINFSNPSGLLAEAVLNHTDIKMIGLCNVPINMKKAVTKLVSEKYEEPGKCCEQKVCGEPEVDYVGLNHLSWITGVYCDGKEILQDYIRQCADSTELPRPAVLGWDAELLRIVKGYPSSYLNYYYYRESKLEHLLKEEKSRGEVCKDIEKELLALYMDPNLKEKPAVLDKRGGALYSEAAVSLISAIHNDKNEIHIINTRNNGALDFMDDNDVVEIGCRVNKKGVTPIPLKTFDNEHIKGLMKTVKAYEKHAVAAGLNGDYGEAMRALMIHPLVGDYTKAKGAFDELLEAHREFLPQFK